MHGLVLMNLQRFLQKQSLPHARDRTFKGDETYEDDELEALLAPPLAAGPETREDLLRAFGRYLGTDAFPDLAPDFYARHSTLQSCLLSVEDQIHTVVRSALPGAAPPYLRVTPLATEGAVIAYTSSRRLCALLEGLVEGTAERYGTAVTIGHPQCMHRGDPSCAIVVEAAAAART